MLHNKGTGNVAACWGLVTGGIGGRGICPVILGLTPHDERVLVAAVRARI